MTRVPFLLLISLVLPCWPSAALAQDAEPRPAFLGVSLEDGPGAGVAVSRVIEGSAAESAGLLVEDRILGIAGRATDAADEVVAILAVHKAGEVVQVVFRRGRELRVVDVTLGVRTQRQARSSAGRLERVLAVLRVQPGQVVADIGCGSGWLAIGVAEVVGEKGLVYAVEIDRSSVERLKERASANIEAVHSKADDVSLPEGVLDLAVLHDVASHVKKEGRPDFYASVERALKEDGRLVIFAPHGKARAMLDELVGYGFHAEDGDELDRLSTQDLNRRLKEGVRFLHRAQHE